VVGFGQGSLIAFAHDDGKITIFDYSSKKVLAEATSDEAISSISFDQNGLQLVSGHVDGSVRIWDLRKVSKGAISLLAKQD
jgi:WD40 repeat protein